MFHFSLKILPVLFTFVIATSVLNAQSTYIQIISEPGISVFLDELFKGKTTSDIGGLIIESVQPGSHNIKVIKEGFNPQDERISIKQGEVYTYKVKPFIPAIKITQKGNVGQQQIDLKVGKIKIQSLPVTIAILIPGLGVSSSKTQDEWDADEIPVGDYYSTFTWNNKVLHDTIKVNNNQLTHLFVNMIKGEVEVRSTKNETVITKEPDISITSLKATPPATETSAVVSKNISPETKLTSISLENESTVTDIDGNIYNKVKIGTQVWMKENLKTTRYRDGSPISDKVGGDYYIYDKNIYGILYNYAAVKNIHNLCPTGWHVSTEDEWNALETFFGGRKTAGGIIKRTGDSDFSGLLGGFTFGIMGFMMQRDQGAWWTSNGSLRMIAIEKSTIYRAVVGVTKRDGLSVRCVKDN